MKKDVYAIYKLFICEEYNGLLEGLCEIRECNFVIFDEEGYLINGKWNNKTFNMQLPGIREIENEYYAIYDTRYCKGHDKVKMYSEFMHEMFHCIQMRGTIDINRKDLLEGSALLFEIMVYSKYTNVPVEELLCDYGKIMTEKKYRNYYLGANEVYKKILNGISWEKILYGNESE